MSDGTDELQRMADYLECRWGERPVGPPKWLTDMWAARPHHPECGNLAGATCEWCGCMYRCPRCEAK